MKTNKNWYPFNKYGSYFKLVKNTLLQSPMNIDGSMAYPLSPVIEVAWDLIDAGDVINMKKVVKKLEKLS